MMLSRGQKLGVVVAIVSLLACGVSVKSQIDAENSKTALREQNSALTQFVACQSGVNDQLVRALTARTDATNQYNESLNKLITSLFSAKTPQQATAVFEEWKAQLAKTAADRASHPYPAPPATTCGTPPKAPR
jgi:hypothetical protein